jgi:GntR family transcriptional regulator
MRAIGENPQTKVIDMGTIPASATAAAALRVKEGEQVIRIRRLRLIQGRPFVIHTAVLPFPLCKAVLDSDLENGSLTSILEKSLGFRLQKAQESISACPATAEDSKVLDVQAGFPVLVVEGLTFDEKGRRVRFSIGRYRSDLVRLQTFHERDKEGT